jgi:hypothetical protein
MFEKCDTKGFTHYWDANISNPIGITGHDDGRNTALLNESEKLGGDLAFKIPVKDDHVGPVGADGFTALLRAASSKHFETEGCQSLEQKAAKAHAVFHD